jgi:hypothetical protein
VASVATSWPVPPEPVGGAGVLGRRRGRATRPAGRSRRLRGDWMVDRKVRWAGCRWATSGRCAGCRGRSARRGLRLEGRHGVCPGRGRGWPAGPGRAVPWPGRVRLWTRRAASGSCAAPTPPIRPRRGWWRSRRTLETEPGRDPGRLDRRGPRLGCRLGGRSLGAARPPVAMDPSLSAASRGSGCLNRSRAAGRSRPPGPGSRPGSPPASAAAPPGSGGAGSRRPPPATARRFRAGRRR